MRDAQEAKICKNQSANIKNRYRTFSSLKAPMSFCPQVSRRKGHEELLPVLKKLLMQNGSG